jgi:hypothetical protein
MTRKTKVIHWDEAETLLKGAVVEEIGKSWMVLRKDDRRIYVSPVCYQCGDGYFAVETESPPQRG